jgi:hypothetical protein
MDVSFNEILGTLPADTSAVRLHLPSQDLEKGCFGQAVAADKGDLVPTPDGEVQSVQYG